MANTRINKSPNQRVYVVLPAGRLAAWLAQEGAPLGPLAEPEPQLAVAPPPETRLASGPFYSPHGGANPATEAPQGFFLDRYI